MKICVLSHLFPARSETFVREHVVGLASRGHEVTVIAREAGDKINVAEINSLSAWGIRVVYVASIQGRLRLLLHGAAALLRRPSMINALRRPAVWKRRKLLIANRYIDEVSKSDPEIVHIHFGDLAARIAHLVSQGRPFLPTVVTWHGFEANALAKILGADLYKPLFSTDSVHTVGSNFMKNRLLQLGARENTLNVIPMGVDLQRFTYKQRLAQSHGPLKILSVGRLDDMKGHKYLIKAVSNLLRSGLPIQLRIVGDGPKRAELSRLISDANCQESIHLLGALATEDVVKQMHAADVFALTGVEASSGKVETQGVVFAEAQATGLPVIASQVGGVAESIEPGVTGILCEQRNVAQISEAINFFVENRDEVRAFGQKGREFVEKRFAKSLMLARFEAVYRSTGQSQ